MSNPLLTPNQQAHVASVRALQHFDTATLSDNDPINWERLHALIPWIAFLFAGFVWATFLLIPTAFGLHYAGMFPAASNWLYVLMGLTLCLACFVAAQVKHGARAILFAFAVLLLSYWF